MNIYHRPGVEVGDQRCNCVMCERTRKARNPVLREADKTYLVNAELGYCGRCGKDLPDGICMSCD